MKKLFVIAFALMCSFTTAFAGEDNNTGGYATHDEDNETPESGGGGSAGEIYVITFRGWCGEAKIRHTFNHEPSDWEMAAFKRKADEWCDIRYYGPLSIIGIYK